VMRKQRARMVQLMEEMMLRMIFKKSEMEVIVIAELTAADVEIRKILLEAIGQEAEAMKVTGEELGMVADTTDPGAGAVVADHVVQETEDTTIRPKEVGTITIMDEEEPQSNKFLKQLLKTYKPLLSCLIFTLFNMISRTEAEQCSERSLLLMFSRHN